MELIPIPDPSIGLCMPFVDDHVCEFKRRPPPPFKGTFDRKHEERAKEVAEERKENEDRDATKEKMIKKNQHQRNH